MIGIRRGCARPKDTRPETESIKPRPCPKSIYPLASIRPGTSCLDLVSSTAFIENRFGFASSSLLWSRLSHCRLPITGAVYQLPYRNLRNLSRGRYTRMFRAKDILSKKRWIEFSFCGSFFCIIYIYIYIWFSYGITMFRLHTMIRSSVFLNKNTLSPRDWRKLKFLSFSLYHLRFSSSSLLFDVLRDILFKKRNTAFFKY